MTLFTEENLRSRARTERLQKSVTTASILRESLRQDKAGYDVFLSHSKIDEDLIHGAKKALDDYGLTVYVDWIEDPQLNRTQVTPSTANTLRCRMRISKMLIYAHTENSVNSRWCPWELGYFDGFKGGNVFLLPIANESKTSFKGQEYVGLYPYLDHVGSSIFINLAEGGTKALREAKSAVIKRA